MVDSVGHYSGGCRLTCASFYRLHTVVDRQTLRCLRPADSVVHQLSHRRDHVVHRPNELHRRVTLPAISSRQHDHREASPRATRTTHKCPLAGCACTQFNKTYRSVTVRFCTAKRVRVRLQLSYARWPRKEHESRTGKVDSDAEGRAQLVVPRVALPY